MGFFSGPNQENEKAFIGAGFGITSENYSKTEAEAEVAKLPPNVKFVGKRQIVGKEAGGREMVSIEAPASVSDGDTFIELPETLEQKAGFYHENAGVLVSLFPDDYKLIVPKG